MVFSKALTNKGAVLHWITIENWNPLLGKIFFSAAAQAIPRYYSASFKVRLVADVAPAFHGKPSRSVMMTTPQGGQTQRDILSCRLLLDVVATLGLWG